MPYTHCIIRYTFEELAFAAGIVEISEITLLHCK
jgi:hypothetical protein